MLKAGDKAPDFSLVSSRGEQVSLSDFSGKQVVLYFYPRDNTPGCTKEACAFRDVYDEILERGAVVLGISPDNTDSHNKFIGKYTLPFFLLSDPDHSAAEAYGAWGEKRTFGKVHKGILRSTFIIDSNGCIKKVFANVKPDAHAVEVLDALLL